MRGGEAVNDPNAEESRLDIDQRLREPMEKALRERYGKERPGDRDWCELNPIQSEPKLIYTRPSKRTERSADPEAFQATSLFEFELKWLQIAGGLPVDDEPAEEGDE